MRALPVQLCNQALSGPFELYLICEAHSTGGDDGDHVHRYLVAAAEASGGGRVFLPQTDDSQEAGAASPVDRLTGWHRVVGALRLDVLLYPDVGMEPVTFFLSFARLATLQVVPR
jgi:hypothetical protein